MKVAIVRAADGSDQRPLPCAGTIMVMPYIDESMARRATALMASRADVEDSVVIAIEDARREGFVSIANRAFAATDSRYFGYVAQDAFPGRRWLSPAIATLDKSNKHLLGFNDGKWMGMLASFGLVSRFWADRNYSGELFYPGYRSHYADTELTVFAMSDGVYAYNANCVMVEVDWEKDRKAVDDADRALFRTRAHGRFGSRVNDPALLKMFS